MGKQAEERPASRLAGALQTAQGLLSAGGLVTLGVYLLGVYITSRYFDQYDVPLRALARWNYLAAGAGFAVLLVLAVPAILGVQAAADWLRKKNLFGRSDAPLCVLGAYALGGGALTLCIHIASTDGLRGELLPQVPTRVVLFALAAGLTLGPLVVYTGRVVVPHPTPFRLWLVAFLSAVVLLTCAQEYGSHLYERMPRMVGGGQRNAAELMVNAQGAYALDEAAALCTTNHEGGTRVRVDPEARVGPVELVAAGRTEVYVRPGVSVVEEDGDTYYVVVSRGAWSACVRLPKSEVLGTVFQKRAPVRPGPGP